MSKELDQCVGFQLKLTKNVMEVEHNKYLKEFGISSEQGLLLKLVYEMPGCTQTQLSELLHKDKTTITRMIDTLAKKDALVRKNCEKDRRVYQIYLTKQTIKHIEEISPIFEKRDEELKNIINKEDYKTTIKVLNQIKEYYRGLNK